MPDVLTVTRTFDAPRELVYEAWTKPEHFSVWFGTDAVEVPLDTLSLDVRVGGAWKATMKLPDGNQIDWVGEYTEVDPPERLSFTMTDEPGTPAGDPIVVTFAEVDGGTEMTLTQPAGDFDQEQIDATIMGYNGFFDSMEKLLAARN
ncbi:SRPBCC domain-containing protein [Kribbella sancticallisti]|uniref:SRPBCC domain-containing protein n=1 Tax=Kribbella sancticallisti TaxID=460087 RepID=A0ABN2ERC4_9ACTN